MRVLTQTELTRLTRRELLVLQHRIVCELPTLPAGSAELRSAHASLVNIRRALAMPGPLPRP